MCCGPVLAEGSVLPGADEGASVHIHLPPEPRSAAAARRFVQHQLPDRDEEAVASIVLLVSELVTNAVLHARTGLQVGVTIQGDEVLIGVGDGDIVLPEQRPYSDHRTDGRGVTLVRSLSSDWGVLTYDGGKTVWFTLNAPGSER